MADLISFNIIHVSVAVLVNDYMTVVQECRHRFVPKLDLTLGMRVSCRFKNNMKKLQSVMVIYQIYVRTYNLISGMHNPILNQLKIL